MKLPENERKQWWLYCYAVTSMEKAVDTCEILIAECPDNRHRLFPALSLAVHTFYARPFKKSRRVGQLPDDIVPQSARGIHHWLVHFRDAVFSHTDANHSEAAGQPMHDVVYSQFGANKIFSTSDPRVRIEAYHNARNHCASMREMFLGRVLEFHCQYPDLLPVGDGDFLLGLDGAGDLFMPHTVPIEATLNYK